MTKANEKREGLRAPLTLAASFTLGPVIDHLASLSAQLAWPTPIRSVPYGRFAAQLSDAEGHFWAPASFRAILLHPKDLGRDISAAVKLITDALRIGDDGTSLRIVIGDVDPVTEKRAVELLSEAVSKRSHVEVIGTARIFAEFDLSHAFDELTDRTGHLPYTDDGMSALALDLGRQIDRHLRPPIKIIAVDGDQTLWSGVLGEDGVHGVGLDPSHLQLQDTIKVATQQGMILTLLTKNEEADISDLLSSRSDFPLEAEDFFEIHADWNEKSDNLARLAGQQGVSQEAILFLDDNPVEIARMREAMPGVLAIEVGTEDSSAGIVDSLWPLDRMAATADDTKRVARLKEEAIRQQASEKADSLTEFFDTLDLKIEISTPSAEDIARLSQLSQRTNQFNTSLKRCSEADLLNSTRTGASLLRAISVSDRYGDYGLVGMVLGQIADDTLELELFCLSCRVLGRGVEYHILRRLVNEHSVQKLSIRHVTGPRNQPVRRFLEGVTGQHLPEEGVVEISKAQVESQKFDPASSKSEAETLIAPALEGMVGRTEFYQSVVELAQSKLAPAKLFFRQNDRPELCTPFAPSRDETEREIAKIWEDVLGISPVGREDDFTELGGKSLDLVRIHARLVRELKADLSLADLFRFSTIKELSEQLTITPDIKSDRAAAMRNARLRRVRRTV